MDVEWNLHSRDGAPAAQRANEWQDIWPELAETQPQAAKAEAREVAHG